MMTYIIIGFVVAFVLLLCFCLAVASFSFDNYNDKLKDLNLKRNSAGISTLDYVRQINQNSFDNRLRIARCEEYKDHYSKNEVALSDKTMYSNSLASLSIVSHELGHARQDASGDKLVRHWKMRKGGRILGILFMPFMLVGSVFGLLYVFSILTPLWTLIVGIGCLALGLLIFVFALVLKYREIQIEKEASVFALDYLRQFLSESEVKLCQEFLNSARLTYWASLFRTMLGWTFLTGKDKMFR